MSCSTRAFSTIVRPGLQSEFASLKFVPSHVAAKQDDIQQFHEFIYSKKRILFLTGAGVSTESGIPDYRGEGVGLYATSKSKPMQIQDFIRSAAFRRRYWARNYIGWPAFASLRPNLTHQFLAELENKRSPSVLQWLITQNVDGLHVKAGSRRITELHGTAFQVACLECDHMITREKYQQDLRQKNPTFHAQVTAAALRPDADVELTDDQVKSFEVVACGKCDGIMKPYIVYFGENVPKKRVDFLMQQADECDSLIVFGSSLQVYSGYRFAMRAAEGKKPICIVNIGPTRGDHLATLRLDKVRCTDILAHL